MEQRVEVWDEDYGKMRQGIMKGNKVEVWVQEEGVYKWITPSSPDQALEAQVGNAIGVLVEIMNEAISDRTRLDAARTLLQLAGVGKIKDEVLEVESVDVTELQQQILDAFRKMEEKEIG